MTDASSDFVASPPFRRLFANQDIVRRAAELGRDLRAALGEAQPCLVQVIEGANPGVELGELRGRVRQGGGDVRWARGG